MDDSSSLICDSAIPVEFGPYGSPRLRAICQFAGEASAPTASLRLEFRFPGAAASAIAATRVDQDEELPGAWIADRPFWCHQYAMACAAKAEVSCETPTMTKSAKASHLQYAAGPSKGNAFLDIALERPTQAGVSVCAWKFW